MIRVLNPDHSILPGMILLLCTIFEIILEVSDYSGSY